jgi:hypothetical protein
MSPDSEDLPPDGEAQEGPLPDEAASLGEPIPKILHSFYEDRPFVSCTRCGESLMDFEEGYRISKNFNKDECLIEYALCLPCLDAMLDEASEESKVALAKFQAENLREVSGLNECALCEKKFDTVKGGDYSFAGVCQGDRMIDSAMVCFDCMEAMANVMSEETKRTWDKFREENFPGVPSDFEPFPNQGAPIVF